MRKNGTNPDVKRTASIKGTMKAAAMPLALVLLGAAPLMPRQAQTFSRPATAAPPTFYPRRAADSAAALPELPPARRNRAHAVRHVRANEALRRRYRNLHASDRKMPPWFADPSVGHFSNDPSLTQQEINVLASWASAGAPAGNPQRRPAAATMGRRLEHSAARSRRENAEAGGDSRPRRRGIHIRNRADRIHRRPMGADVRDSAGEPRERPSRGRLHSPAGFAMAAACARWQAVYRVRPDERARPHGRAVHHERHFARLCAGKFAGQLAGRHGEVRARRLRSRLPDALHDERPRRERRDQHRDRVREAAAEAARADACS